MHENHTPLVPADLDLLRRLEESLWIVETRYDLDLMEQLFAPDFIEFGRSGRVYERAELLLSSKEPREFLATLPLPEFQARHLAPDIIQITYISEVRYDNERERANRSSIWSRYPEGWRLRFHQGTAIGPS